jgi:cellulose synthase (UDP-forming)
MRIQTRFYSVTVIIILLSSLIIFFSPWICQQEIITYFLNYLYLSQQNFPSWLILPEFNSYFPSFLPLIVGVLIVQITMLFSPQQNELSRIIIVFTTIFFTIRYFWWRWHSSLNLTDPINGIFSIGLFLMELILIISPFWQSILMLKVKNRKSQADRMLKAVKEGIYQPTVDILIPSYNEPLEVVKRTIVGCQAIKYNHKKIYLLDDGNRQEIKQLCQELKCNYIIRENHFYAKAGNLNHALSQTNGELIVVFDADFIPTTNFLNRTVGFFQDIKIGLLQTYQSFYSHDPIARNLGLENKIPTEVEIFSRYYQPIRDSINTALCYGSSFVVRRQNLINIGGFVTNTLSEDYHTGIRLASENYQVIYLAESLSAGLSAENIFGHIRQRKRWARGTIQTLFIKENPLLIKGLKWWQRLAHLEGIFQWFNSPIRLILLLLPLAYNTLNVIPIKANLDQTIYFFLPFYFIQLLTFSWVNYRTRSALLADIYNVVTAVPLTREIIETIISPFSSIFKVTPKGIKNDNYYFNWRLASPLIFIFIINIITFFNLLSELNNNNIAYVTNSLSLNIILFWNIYNLIILALSLIVMIDIPKLDSYQWLTMGKKVRIITPYENYEVYTNKLCEIGAEISINSFVKIPSEGKIEFISEGLLLKFKTIDNQGKNSNIKIIFDQVSLSEYRQLIKMIFCLPNRWHYQQTPRELMSFLLLIRALFTTPLQLLKSTLVK